jgi:hypothetical protein
MSLLTLLSTGGVVEITPPPAILISHAPDPVSVLGGLAITTPPAILISHAPDPVSVLGGLAITPPPAILTTGVSIRIPTTINFFHPRMNLLSQKKRMNPLKKIKIMRWIG